MLFKEPKYARGAKLLLNSLRFFTRIEHDQFSHYNSSLQHLNDIDHVFISAPGWQQTLKRVQVSVEQPEVLFAKGLSDHGALTCRFPSSKIPISSQPIPTWVAKLPNFSLYLGQLVNASKLHQLMPEHALMEYKRLIREAARLARNNYYTLNREPPDMYIANLVLISRLIVDNNTRQAGQLIQNSVFFFSRIFVADSKVQLHDPVKFADEFRDFKHSHYHKHINHLIQQNKPNSSKIEAATRLSRLWSAHAPVNCVAAITAENGDPNPGYM